MATSHSAPAITRSSSTSRLPDATTPMIALSFLPGSRFLVVCLKLSVCMGSPLLPVAKLIGRVVEVPRPMHQILDRSGGQHAAARIQWINTKVLRAADYLPRAQLLDHLTVAPAAYVGEACDATNGLLAFLRRAAEQQVGDSFFADDVGHVLAVDHDRRQIELELLRKLYAIELLDEDRHHLFAEGLDQLHDELTASHDLRD